MCAAKTPEVKLTHLDKPSFPKSAVTKGDVIQYYIHVARHILPHLKKRPVTLIRYPDGVEGEHFYEKNAPAFTPAWVDTFDVHRRHEAGSIHYIVINSAPILAWCANIGGLEIHPFLHTVSDPDRPTCVVFDLDPGEGSNILSCGRVALLVKDLLGELDLKGFPKVTGSKGLQVYVPLNRKVSYAATGAFAKAVAELLERRHPELVVSGMAKARRRNRVLIDWSQNSPAKTTVAVYSMRGKRAAPFVSAPLTWDELKRAIQKKKPAALDFSPDATLKRLKARGDLFAPVLTLKQSLPQSFLKQKAPAAPLERYEAKRDFTKTREPGARLAGGSTQAKGRFVIQKHAASHLHYDFRLEMDGTLKSWAVPKGLSTQTGVKRAAFEVEDHPVDYLKFEGTIPKGQYGGGTVMVWDIGEYEVIGGNHENGDLKLILHGKKLSGEWHIFRIHSDPSKPMWLVTKSGKSARAVSVRKDDSSVLTGRSMAQIASNKKAR